MIATAAAATADDELVFSLLANGPRDKLPCCWIEPARMTRWFTPPPWKAASAEVDLRPGGAGQITIQGPDGAGCPTAVFTSSWSKTAVSLSQTLTRASGCRRPNRSTPTYSRWRTETANFVTPQERATGCQRTVPCAKRWAFMADGALPQTGPPTFPRHFHPALCQKETSS